jgi:outer membrane protein assembly factor BamB
MKTRLLFFIVLAAALLLSTGASCQRTVKPPVFVSVPDNVFAGEVVHLRLVTYAIGYQSTGYVMDWGDTVETDSGRFLLGDTATVSHVWSEPGVKQVRARAFPFVDPTRLTDWSERETVVVVPGGEGAPVIDTVFFDPPVAVKGVEEFFTVMAHDPDGDSVRLVFDWGAGDTTTAYFASPCTFRFSHVFTQIETAAAIVTAQDTRGAVSRPDTVYVPVGYAGGVIWYWQSSDPENPGESFTTSPVIVVVGGEERLFGGDDGDHEFYSIRTSDRKGERKQTTRWPECDFTGQPAFCEATQHIIVGSDEGELYALKVDGLGKAWQWPDNPESLLTGLEWGAPAIKDNRLYVPHEDDSLFYFIDSVDHCVRMATFTPHASFVDAPVIDVQGNVYFGTDSGYLYKMGPELDTVFWRTRLLSNGEIHSPIIGNDGTIYCASDFSRVYAIDPVSGTPSWVVTLEGEPFRLALGQTALFVASSFGKVYSISPATGTVSWDRQLSPTEGFYTTPIVAANGYVYFQDDADVLYCLDQADGMVIWTCDCPRYLPRTGGNSHRPRRMQLTDYPPNPTILSNGNIIVAGSGALYCVAGYPERPLDPLAPWPKWQHNLYNTGCVSSRVSR